MEDMQINLDFENETEKRKHSGNIAENRAENRLLPKNASLLIKKLELGVLPHKKTLLQ